MASSTSKRGYLTELLRSKQTVFSFKELLLMWGGIKRSTALVRVHSYVKTRQLHQLRRGLYAKELPYDVFEAATRIFTPSYISFETVLAANGMIFQYDGRIHAASYQSKTITVSGTVFVYKTLQYPILTAPDGIERRDFYSIASAERAFLDTVYLYPKYHMDNLSSLNWDKVTALLPIYGGNRRMARDIRRYSKTSGQKQ